MRKYSGTKQTGLKCPLQKIDKIVKESRNDGQRDTFQTEEFIMKYRRESLAYAVQLRQVAVDKITKDLKEGFLEHSNENSLYTGLSWVDRIGCPVLVSKPPSRPSIKELKN